MNPEPPPGDVDLFGEPITQPPVRSPQDDPASEATEGKKPSWSKRRGARPEKCDVCVALMLAGGPWRAPNPATHVRVTPQQTMLLCYPHSQEQRVADGLTALPR